MAHPTLPPSALEQAIDEVVASYEGPDAINNLESAAMPNRRAVIEAYRHLTPALYLGFYSLRGLHRDNLRYSISEHVYPAYELLVEQIQRATHYTACRDQQPPKPAGWSEAVALRVIRLLPSLRRCLAQDVVAAFEGDPAAESIEEVVFSYPGVRAITAHRIAHVLHEAGVPIVPRIIAEHAHGETGIDIHAGARIGERCFIDHGSGVVIGSTAVLGRNVKLYQGVTLGALSVSRPAAGECSERKRHPTIGDDVTIYAGAKILGGETVIGSGSVIGGNVWLVESVPPNSRIFGREREPHPVSGQEPAAKD